MNSKELSRIKGLCALHGVTLVTFEAPKIKIKDVEYLEKKYSGGRASGKTLKLIQAYNEMYPDKGLTEKTRGLTPIQVFNEYSLIQEKKSILSRSEREYITTLFNRYYEKK